MADVNSTLPWSSKRFFFTVVFSTATFAASFAIGSGITIAFGPGLSGIATILITTIIMVIGANSIKTRGYFTVAVMFFTILAIPTQMFGPAGPHKIFIGFLTGLIYDLVWTIAGRNRTFSLPIAAAVSTAFSIIFILTLMKLFYPDHMAIETLSRLWMLFSPIYGALGFIGAWIGNYIFNKSIKDSPLIKKL